MSPPVRFVTADGLTLVGDLHLPGGDPVGAAVVCHPHPRYGGDRGNPVVVALARALAAAGWTALRFDFRGTGTSEGVHGGGRAERADVAAALDAVVDAAGGAPVPLLVTGYSFGAAVALSTTDPRIRGWVGVALPLALAASLPDAALPDERPVLLLAPEHDQFSPAADVTAAVAAAAWPNVTVRAVPMADHFLAGATDVVAAEAVAFAATLVP
jgi:alpha/beta superfamily hydrolase